MTILWQLIHNTGLQLDIVYGIMCKLEGKFAAHASIVCLRHHMRPISVNCKKKTFKSKKKFSRQLAAILIIGGKLKI